MKFETQIKIEGKTVRGSISEGKFFMLPKTEITSIALTAEQLGEYIEELQKVREKMLEAQIQPAAENSGFRKEPHDTVARLLAQRSVEFKVDYKKAWCLYMSSHVKEGLSFEEVMVYMEEIEKSEEEGKNA